MCPGAIADTQLESRLYDQMVQMSEPKMDNEEYERGDRVDSQLWLLAEAC